MPKHVLVRWMCNFIAEDKLQNWFRGRSSWETKAITERRNTPFSLNTLQGEKMPYGMRYCPFQIIVYDSHLEEKEDSLLLLKEKRRLSFAVRPLLVLFFAVVCFSVLLAEFGWSCWIGESVQNGGFSWAAQGEKMQHGRQQQGSEDCQWSMKRLRVKHVVCACYDFIGVSLSTCLSFC